MKKIVYSLILLFLILPGCFIHSGNLCQAFAFNEKEFDGYIILGRPTDTGITARIIASNPTTIFLEYGKESGHYTHKTEQFLASRKEPASITIDGLDEGCKYYYRLCFTLENLDEMAYTKAYSFTTARPEGESFTFAIQSDSHLLNKADKGFYQKVMENIATKQPDFFFDLGDTFLNDKDLNASFDTINDITYEQVPFFSTAAKYSPLFLVIGNHEGEYGYLLDGTAENMPVHATLSRKQYFPNPVPNDFYSGNPSNEDFIGQPEDYYAFTWGDALFVALDPYRYTMKDPKQSRDSWDWTLGETQYQWLKNTLETSEAKYKFVFVHHAIGNIRGGAKIANLYEWGGCNTKGSWFFDKKRPGWDKPIHQLMVDNHVTIFFQGHDHIFARENVDGVIYQTMPKPAEIIPDQECNLQYYENADTQINSGYLEVRVSPEEVQVDYIRLVVAGQPDNPDTGIVYSYKMSKSGEFDVLKSTDDRDAFAAYSVYDPVKNKDNKKGQKKKQDDRENKNIKKKNNKESKNVPIELSEDIYDKTFLGRPTDKSISISTAFNQETQYYYQYGKSIEKLDEKTVTKTAPPGTVQTETITSLQSGTKYYYQLCQKKRGKENYDFSKVFSFHTQCPSDSEYTFLVEADPHLDENSDDNIYKSILSGMLKQEADFIIDLGDSSMAEKLASNQEEIIERNILLRSYWDNIAHSIPFFMVIGNHDGEAGWNNKGKNPIGDFAAFSRRTYFPNPTPGRFYSGLNDTSYGWEWGNALFIVLNPFSFTDKKPQDANWQWTLGKEQYDWLRNALEQSHAKYKFVFIHHLVGGRDEFARGGTEAAALFEWGGNDSKGIDSFDKMRPNWEMPIHQLLKENDVDIVFHGHDHFYAKEALDGIIYQLVPQPSSREKKQNSRVLAEEYGYKDGVLLSSPGFLRITVSPDFAKIDYLQGIKGEIADSYLIH